MSGEGGERPTTVSFQSVAAGRCGGGGRRHSLVPNGRRYDQRQPRKRGREWEWEMMLSGRRHCCSWRWRRWAAGSGGRRYRLANRTRLKEMAAAVATAAATGKRRGR